MDTLGAVMGPALALFFLTFLNYRQIIAISAIPGVAALLVVLLFVREVRKKPSPNTPIVSAHGGLVVKDKGFVTSIKTLPRSFQLFLVGVGVLGWGISPTVFSL